MSVKPEFDTAPVAPRIFCFVFSRSSITVPAGIAEIRLATLSSPNAAGASCIGNSIVNASDSILYKTDPLRRMPQVIPRPRTSAIFDKTGRSAGKFAENVRCGFSGRGRNRAWWLRGRRWHFMPAPTGERQRSKQKVSAHDCGGLERIDPRHWENPSRKRISTSRSIWHPACISNGVMSTNPWVTDAPPVELTGSGSRVEKIVKLSGIGAMAVALVALAVFFIVHRSGPLYPIPLNGKYGYIDKTGRLAVPAQFDDARAFAEGLAPVQSQQKWGYIDQNGRLAIPQQYDTASPFSQGLALVGVGPKLGYIGRDGRFVVNPQYDQAGAFGDGLAPVQVAGRWGYINKDGKFPIDLQFDDAGAFSEGLAPVRFSTVYGYIDRKGKLAINPAYLSAGRFSDGLAAVNKGGKFGYINESGKMSIEPQFDSGGDFSDGLALVSIGSRFGFINKDGKFAVNPRFDQAGSFSGVLAPVWIGTHEYYIDGDGMYVWKSAN